MTTSFSHMLIILGCVVLNTIAQLSLKMGMKQIGHFEFSVGNLVPVSLKIAGNPFIFGGVVSFAFSLALWVLALSRVDVSYAYPMTSLGYITTALAGFWILQEPLTPTRMLGIAVILLGVYLVSRS